MHSSFPRYDICILYIYNIDSYISKVWIWEAIYFSVTHQQDMVQVSFASKLK